MAGSWSLRQLFGENVHQQVEEFEGAGSTEMVAIGDFTINAAERTTAVLGEELGLTSEELFSTTHPQLFVTSHTILATSWAGDSLHQTEFLKALFSLRKRLDAIATGKQYLRTEPWVIYRFRPTLLA